MSGDGHVLRARAGEEGKTELLAPGVGIFLPTIDKGRVISPGEPVGTIEVLGVRTLLLTPPGVTGRVSERAGQGSSRVAVQYGDVLLSIAALSLGHTSATEVEGPVTRGAGLAFVAPMSGRFYSRPSPSEPPFVEDGDTVSQGQTIGLLEVMKTFNRLVYRGESLPERALIERIVPGDGEDVARGDVILVLAATES